MAEYSLLGLVDSYGIELIHPRREGRSEKQIGEKGLSNKRWIVGAKVCYVLNHLGLVVDWELPAAHQRQWRSYLVADIRSGMAWN